VDLIRRTFETEIKAATTEGDLGVVEAIVSVFGNVDSQKERVLPGFFKDSIAARLPKGVWMHDWKQPVAKTLEARELAPGDPALPPSLKNLGGLYIKSQFNLETQRGREAFSDIKHGIIDQYSIGYQVTEDRYDAKGVRDLVKGRLHEWSPVLVGANESTVTVSAKSDEPAVETKAYRGSYEELAGMLATMCRTRFGSGWIVATYPDRLVFRAYNYDDEGPSVTRERYFQVPYSFNEDGSPSLGESVEVEQAFVPAVKALDEKIGRMISRGNRERLGKCMGHMENAVTELKALYDESDSGEGKDDGESEVAPVSFDAKTRLRVLALQQEQLRA